MHDTPLVEIMSGTLFLDRALRKESEVGFKARAGTRGGSCEYCYNFGGNSDRQKTMFFIVRKAWKNISADMIIDDFSISKSSLRAWVGLW